MMKYSNERVVEAKYTNPQGNPFAEALPPLLSKKEFDRQIRSKINCPKDPSACQPQERRAYLMELSKWFQPMDYMYQLYDMLYRAMSATYQTKNVVDSVRQINELYTDFRTGREREFQYSTQGYSTAILGVPGIGKTSTLQRCLSTMPQVITHTRYQNTAMYTKQINYLFVECPSDCSVKTLAFNIFAAIDKAIGSDYLKQASYQKSMATSATTTRLKIICLNHHIGLIVIDEIQNAIQTAAKNRQIKPLIKFLVELTNETTTGICFCGTLEAEAVFEKQEHLKRRTRGYRLLPLKFDVTYRRFITELWEHQVVLKKKPLTEKLMKQMYDLSAGIPAYLVKIFEEAQVQAILSGKEEISYEVIKQAVMMLGIEVPKVYGKYGTSISDFTVQEVQMKTVVSEFSTEQIDSEPDETKVESTIQTEMEAALEAECMKEESTEKEAKRFYATPRGRKRSEREEADLIAAWTLDTTGTILLHTLETCQMLERRCF